MPYDKKAADKRAPKTSASRGAGSKPGSRSANHRGYRADEGAAPKKRWTTEDRAARGGRAGDRNSGAAAGRDDRRPDWTPRENRPQRAWNSDRPQRSNDRNDRGGDRPQRSYGDAPKRSYGNDRPARSFDDRAPRSYGNDRPARSFDDRPKRSFDGDRAPRSFDRSDRPARSNGDRAPRSYGNDRPVRSNDRPARSFDGDRAPRSFDRSERPARSFDDRPKRSFDGDRSERPARSYGDRPDRGDRPARSFDGDRAPRSVDRSDRPARSFDDRPKRSFDGDRAERPARGFDRADRVDRVRSFAPSFAPGQEDVVLERLEAVAIEAKDVDGITFGDLGLGANIVRELTEMGAASPFPIQAATIPDVLAGRDVLGRGRTGSGKTIAFGAPLVERLLKSQAGNNARREFGRQPRALILAPTRELALQIDRTVQPIARSVGLFTTQIYGGVPYARQLGALQRGVDIIIGTPGRVQDLVNQGRLDLSGVMITVLDEADHMCELGFAEPVQDILDHTGKGGQKLLFSATLDRGVAEIVEKYLVDPSVHEVAGEDQASSTIEHRVLLLEQRDKQDVLAELASGPGKKLVFARTRAFAEQLADMLDAAGIRAESIHGDLTQSRRQRALEKLTSGRVNVLVATDVAARGIHVDDITLVIQADAPDEYKAYLHRAGRTGRAGKEGTVVTLVPKGRRRRTEDLLSRAEITAEWTPVVPGDELISELASR